VLLNLCISQTTDGLCFTADFRVVYDMTSKNLSCQYCCSPHSKCLELFKLKVSYIVIGTETLESGLGCIDYNWNS